ncbi:MAG: branched-chain amino acid ABC transporter permease [Anaerolineaceae bacterium]
MPSIQKIVALLTGKRWLMITLGVLGIVLILGLPLLPVPQKNLWVRIIGYAGLYILLGLGLLIHVGMAGMLDLGFAAYYGIGAYTYAFLASDHFGLHLSFWPMLLVGGLAAALVGVLVCIPVLRLRGDYLAIVTLGFAEICRLLFLNLKPITNGSQGIIGIDKPVLGNLVFNTGTHFYYLIFILIVLFVFLTNRLVKSRTGRAWMAIREDEDVAEMSGVNTTRYKLLAFAAGAFLGGVGGVIFASWQGSIFPDNFNLMASINILCLIILGGLGNIYGVVIGALALIALPDMLRGLSDFRMLIFGILLVVMMILKPEGFLTRIPPKLEIADSANSKEGEP